VVTTLSSCPGATLGVVRDFLLRTIDSEVPAAFLLLCISAPALFSALKPFPPPVMGSQALLSILSRIAGWRTNNKFEWCNLCRAIEEWVPPISLPCLQEKSIQEDQRVIAQYQEQSKEVGGQLPDLDIQAGAMYRLDFWDGGFMKSCEKWKSNLLHSLQDIRYHSL
jgi:hypothetical protein